MRTIPRPNMTPNDRQALLSDAADALDALNVVCLSDIATEIRHNANGFRVASSCWLLDRARGIVQALAENSDDKPRVELCYVALAALGTLWSVS